MKKITFLFFVMICFAFSWQGKAQVYIQESLDSGVPSGWSNAGYYFSNSNSSYYCEGSGNIGDNMYSSAANNGILTSPNYVGVSNGTETTVQFQWLSRPYFTNAVDYVMYVEYSTNDGADWSLVSSFAVTDTNPCTTYSEVIPASSLPIGSDFKFRIRGEWQSGDSYFYLDNLFVSQVLSCPQPSDMIASNITTNSADLSWTIGDAESTWNLEWKAGEDFTPGAGEEDASDVVTTTAQYNGMLTSLDQNTTYYVYYQADCGGGDTSFWVGYTFTTLAEVPNCVETPITPIDEATEQSAVDLVLSWTAPSSGPTPTEYIVYQYDDATGTTPTELDTVTGTSLTEDFSYGEEVFWGVVAVNGTEEAIGCDIWSFTVEDAPLGYDCSNPLAVTTLPYTTSDDTANYGNAYGASDVPSTTGAQYTNGTGSTSYLTGNEVVYSFTPANDGVFNIDATFPTSNWYALWLFEGCPFTSVVAYHTSTSGTTRSLPLLSLTGGTTYYLVVATWASSPQTTTYDLSIEEVLCPEPSNMVANNITTTSADLSWTAGGSETTWNLEWKAGQDFTPGAGEEDGADVVTTTPEYNNMLTGLTSATTYYVYYQASCGTGDSSDWIGFVFNTNCDAVTTFPWFEDFESVTTPELPSCWSRIDANTDGDVWRSYSSYGVGDSQSVGLYTDFNSGNNDDYLILPSFTLTGNERLRYSVRARSSSEPNDYEVLLSTTGNSASDFTTTLLPLTTVSSTTHEEVIMNLDAYSGDVFIAIHVPSGGLDGYYLYLDNFYVEELPSCLPPENLAAAELSSTSAEVSWDAGSSSLWNVEWGVAGFTPGTGDLVTGLTSPNYTIDNITTETEYEFYVQADCGGGDLSTWSGPYLFYIGYCAPSGTSTLTYIDAFTTTGAYTDIQNEASGLSTNNFGNYYDSQAVISAEGQTFDFSVEIVSGSVGTAIWIDWNNDQVFDASEVEFTTTSYGYDQTGSITVPAGTASGDYRMRVMIDWNDNNPGSNGACSFNNGRGEVEDYKLTIDNTLGLQDVLSPTAFTYYPNPVNNNELFLNAQKTIEAVTVFNLMGQQVMTVTPGVANYKVDMSQLTSGAYFVQVAIEGVTKTVKVIKQ